MVIGGFLIDETISPDFDPLIIRVIEVISSAAVCIDVFAVPFVYVVAPICTRVSGAPAIVIPFVSVQIMHCVSIAGIYPTSTTSTSHMISIMKTFMAIATMERSLVFMFLATHRADWHMTNFNRRSIMTSLEDTCKGIAIVLIIPIVSTITFGILIIISGDSPEIDIPHTL